MLEMDGCFSLFFFFSLGVICFVVDLVRTVI